MKDRNNDDGASVSNQSAGRGRIVTGDGDWIGQRQLTEQTLREYQEVVEGSREMIAVVDRDYRFLIANRAFLKYRGLSRDQVVGRCVPEVLDQGLFETVIKGKLDACFWGQLVSFEQKHYCPRRGERDLSASFFPIEGPGGIDRAAWVVQDITDQKRAEEALALSEDLFRGAFDNAPIGMIVNDADGRRLKVNRAFCEMLGYTEDELLQKSFLEVLHPDRHSAAQEGMRSLLDGSAGYKRQETRYLHKDGHVVWANFSSTVVRNPDGSPLYIVAQVEDISERKRDEEALKLFRTLIDQSSDAIEVLDPETLRFIDCNESACQRLGYTREEFLTMGARDIDPHLDDSLATAIAGEMKKSGFVVFESIHRRKDGSIFPVEINSKEIRLERVYRLAVVRDITERKESEELLRQSESQLAEAQQTAHLGSWNWDIQSNALTWSDELYRIYGFEAQEFPVTFECFLDRLHPDDRDCVARAVAECLESHEAFSFQERIVRPDGQVRVLQSHGNVVCDAQGKPIRLFGACQDITDRKKAEDGLRKQKELLQTIFDHIPIMISLVDRDIHSRLVNREWERKLGWSLQELQNSDVDLLSELYPNPEDRERAKEFIREPKGEWADFKIRTRDGRIIDTTWTRIQLSDGSSIGIGEDITERKRADEARREAEEKYRVIFENAGEGIFQSTPEGRYVGANPALARMCGFESPEELISSLRDISREIYVDPAQREEFKRLLEENGIVRGFEHQAHRKDGSKVWISVNARAVRDNSGAICYYEGTAQDIDERKRAEARSAAFAALARKLSGALTPLDAGRIIAQTASDLFGWDSCDLNHYDADRDLVYQLLNIDLIDGKQTEIFGVISGRKPTARGRRIIDHGRELLLREEPIQFDAETIPYGDRTRPSASIMTVPIRHADKVIGLFSIQSYTPHSYDTAALADLQALADHCGEALNRIQAEQALFESEERFRQMADHLEDIIWIADKDVNRVLYINPAYEKIFGRSRASLYERIDSFIKSVHPDDREAARREHERQKAGEHEPFEYRILRPDGAVRWIQRRSFPIRNSQGQVYRVAGIGQDITERKRAEEALRESEERYRELFENAKESIYVHDLSGRYTSINRAAELLTGYTREEILGKHFSNFVAPRDLKQVRKNLCRKLDEENETVYEVDVVTRSGKRVAVEVSSRLIYEKGVAVGVQGVVRDITDRKRAQEALHMYPQRLIQAQEAEREKIARELHDQIGQVLTAVRINLQYAQRSVGLNECMPRLDDSIAIVDEALGRVRELSIELRPSLLDDLGLSTALRWYVDRYARRTGIVAEVLNGLEENGRLPRELETACFRIAQEALSNVARHAKAGSVSVQLERSREKMLLTVMDDGIGLDLDNLRTTASAASALGLRGMEERALAVGGYIEIDSGAGRGTRVRAHFPLKRT